MLIRLLALIFWLYSPALRADVCGRSVNMVKNLEAIIGKPCYGIDDGDLAKLTSFDPRLRIDALQGNDFGDLPPGTFHGLSRLEGLVLWEVGMTSVPADMWKDLGALRHLDLRDNDLTHISDMRGMPNLVTLLLEKNGLEELPEDFCDELPQVTHLNLAHNRLNRWPAGLVGNRIATFPDDVIPQLPMLRQLDLYFNLIPEPEIELLRQQYSQVEFGRYQ